MLYPRSEDPLSEVVDLYRGFQIELPYFATPAIGPDTPVRVLPGVDAEIEPWWLRFNPSTATWCLLEKEEFPVVTALSERRAFGELLGAFGLSPGRLRGLLTNLYRLGLAEVGGKCGLDQAVFARGPLFGKRYAIELITTERCNLACAYCFADADPAGGQMDLETGFDAIDRALALEASSVWLRFDGGETLLDFEHFRRLVTYARDRGRGTGKKLGIGIQLTTNGTVLDPQKADFLAEQGVRVHLSLDGTEEIHDRLRSHPGNKGSYRQAVRALWLLQERSADYMVIGVVGRHNAERAGEVLRHFAELGIEAVRFNPVYLLGRGRRNDVAISPDQYLHFMLEVLDFLAQNRAMREENLAAMAQHLVVRTRDYRCARSPCGAGYDHFAIDPEGYVYPCGAFRLCVPESRLGRLTELPSLDGAFLGNSLVEEMAGRIVAQIPQCADCDWRHLCEGGCSLDAYLDQGGLKSPCSLCPFYRQIYPNLIAALARTPALLNLLVPGAAWCHV